MFLWRWMCVWMLVYTWPNCNDSLASCCDLCSASIHNNIGIQSQTVSLLFNLQPTCAGFVLKELINASVHFHSQFLTFTKIVVDKKQGMIHSDLHCSFVRNANSDFGLTMPRPSLDTFGIPFCGALISTQCGMAALRCHLSFLHFQITWSKC